MNISSSSSDGDISDGLNLKTKRKSTSKASSKNDKSNAIQSQRTDKSKYVLDDGDGKNSNINNKEAVTGSIIQHELHFFEFETKMRKVMYDIIEPNTKRVNSQSGQLNELEKQLKKANMGNT